MTTDEDITSGKAEGILHRGLYDYKFVYPLCTILGLVDQTCPIKKGAHTVVWKGDLSGDPSVSQQKCIVQSKV